MKIGVAYYPEHWPEERWPEDAAMMRQTGIDLVRVGEFAWSRLEPRRGQYDVDWLERAIDVLAAEGLKVILCTPTATPPTWLLHRHPTMVPEDREGTPYYPGSRRHACLNNRPYRRYVRRIVREMAKNLGSKPQVFAWQVDNEFGCHASGRCYCDDCEQAFREWLKRRYGTIERLNKLWGTAFWSQEFLDWHYIPAPRRTPAGVHPSLALDYERFTSATIRDFFNEQRELIEEYAGAGRPITTNTLGLGTDQVNQFMLGSVVDVVAHDNYPIGPENLDGAALQLDLARSARGEPFWVMEQQAGATLIPTRRGQPRPGQLRMWSYQAAARGAEVLSYFRWRTCGWGQEMHWFGMLDPDGSRRRRFEELSSTIGELKEKAELWEGTAPDARVAMALDYDAMWALRADSMGTKLDYKGHFWMLYSLLRARGLAVDVLGPTQSPDEHHGVLIVPMPVLARVDAAGVWGEFLGRGGRLLVTAPAGYRSEYNTWLMTPPPGPYGDLLGVEVIEHDLFSEEGGNHVVLADEEQPVGSFCTIVEAEGAEVLATYRDDFYAGSPAVTRSARGEGAAYYVGAVSTPELYDEVLEAVLEDAGIAPCEWASETVEVIPLRTAGVEPPLTFVLNHSGEPCSLGLSEEGEYTDLLTGEQHCDEVPLEGYGVVLLRG